MPDEPIATRSRSHRLRGGVPCSGRVGAGVRIRASCRCARIHDCTRIAAEPERKRRREKEQRLRFVPYAYRSPVDALQSCGEAGLYRLPRRRRRRGPGRRECAEQPAVRQRFGTRARTAALSGRMAEQREPGAFVHAAEPREPGIHPLRESVRLSSRTRIVRGVPPGDRRGVDQKHALDGCDVLGRSLI